jgi:L-arabinokinase
LGAVCFYISGHGFGHASRQIEIVNALGALAPATPIVIRTSAPPWLFERTLRVPAQLVPGECDTGVVQIDSLHPDIPATIARAREFYESLPARAAHEAGLLRDRGVSLVISDAPPLACAAAADAGIPSVVVSNFTWDWIYDGFSAEVAGTPALVDTIGTAYSRAAAGWRLPMHGGFRTVPNVRDVPFVARHARHPRDGVRRALGLPLDLPIVLVSFGGYGIEGLDLSRLDCLDRYVVLMTEGEPSGGRVPDRVLIVPEARIYDSGGRYEEVVAAVDVVLSKPGYGIISECVASRTGFLYTSRGNFAEYDALVRDMPRFLRSAYIDHAALFAGRWRTALDAIMAAPEPPERPATNGAEVVAGMIAGL